MKRKWFIPLALVAMISAGAYAQQTDDQECPDDDGGGGTTRCYMSVVCYDKEGNETSRVGCSGKDCAKGKTWVACDGKYWDC